MKKVVLPIFFLNDTTSMKTDAGIKYDVTENDVKDVSFYRIDAICPFTDNNDFTTIYSSGDSFVCSLPFKQVEELIEENL